MVKHASNNTCINPDVQTCYDTNNIYVCKAGNTICTGLGFIKNAANNTCDIPSDCTINNQCATGLQACLYYRGYIKSTSSN